MGFRLHIDVPMGTNEEDAVRQAEQFVKMIWENMSPNMHETLKVQYRLGHDDDRQKSNYLRKTEEGHVTTKKSQLV